MNENKFLSMLKIFYFASLALFYKKEKKSADSLPEQLMKPSQHTQQCQFSLREPLLSVNDDSSMHVLHWFIRPIVTFLASIRSRQFSAISQSHFLHQPHSEEADSQSTEHPRGADSQPVTDKTPMRLPTPEQKYPILY